MSVFVTLISFFVCFCSCLVGFIPHTIFFNILESSHVFFYNLYTSYIIYMNIQSIKRVKGKNNYNKQKKTHIPRMTLYPAANRVFPLRSTSPWNAGFHFFSPRLLPSRLLQTRKLGFETSQDIRHISLLLLASNHPSSG